MTISYMDAMYFGHICSQLPLLFLLVLGPTHFLPFPYSSLQNFHVSCFLDDLVSYIRAAYKRSKG